MSEKVFLKAIGSVESGNNPRAKNKQTSATGEHQFMWSQWGDDIQRFAGDPELTRDDFANNPDLQKRWSEYYVKNILDPEVEKLKQRYPEQLKSRGLTNQDDLRSLVHFQGYNRSSEYARTGKVPATKAKNISVPEYIQKVRQKREEIQQQEPKEMPVLRPQKLEITEQKPKEKGLLEKASDVIFPAAQASQGASTRALPEAQSEDEDTSGVSLSAKPLRLIPVEPKATTPKPQPAPSTKPEETSEWEAGARGLAQGASFGFADELTSAVESAFSGRPYREVVEETRKAYETSRKQHPGITLGTEILGGAASSFIPGVGALGRGAQIAAATTKAAKLGQIARGGAQLGALAGLGASQDITKPLETVADVALGAATGGATGAAIGKAGQMISESPVAQNIGKAVSEGAGALKEKLLGKSTKFQFPEFSGTPQKQRKIDAIVAEGKKTGLTDRQILNNIAVEFPDLSRESLESAFREKGIRGKLQRVVAGSEEATEFMTRPDRMGYAEESTRGKTSEVAKQESAIAKTQDIIEQQRVDKETLNRQSQDLSQQLTQKRQELQQRWQTADIIEKQRIDQQIKTLDASEAQLNGLIKQRQNVIDQYNQADKEIADTVKTELEKAAKTRSAETMAGVGKVAQELDELVQLLANQRQELVENLMDVPATDMELEAAMGMRNQLQNVFLDQGMGREGRQALDAAFGGDSRFQKVAKFFDIKRQQQEFDKIKADYDWNVKNGFWDDVGMEVKPGGKPKGRAMLPEARPVLNPEDIPSVGEMVGALYAANQKVSSAAFGTPMANVKRRVGEVIQEGMKDLSMEAYALQRHLARTKANLETLRGSSLFEGKKIPVEGKTGRVATAQKKFIKTELPKDIARWPREYVKTIQNILSNERGPTLELATGMEAAAKRGLPTGTSPRIGQLESDIGGLESKIAKLAQERQMILDEQAAKAPELKLARAEEKRGVIKEGIRSKLNIRNRLRAIDDEMRKLTAQVGEQTKRLGETTEAESQLKNLLLETQGIPASARDVGQAAVIGAQGKIPFAIAKVLLPSPQARIKAYNRVKTRFQNPSLNAAVRVALENPVTLETIRSLSTTHEVSEPELTKALEESGVEIDRGVSMRARPLDSVPEETMSESVEPTEPVEEKVPEEIALIEGIKNPEVRQELMRRYKVISNNMRPEVRQGGLAQLQDMILEEIRKEAPPDIDEENQQELNRQMLKRRRELIERG